MFEGPVVYYLNKYLGAYVQNINSEDLKLHLLSGNVVLRDLQLRPEALNSLDLPLTVKAGMLGTLKLKIPWRSLGKEPVIVEFDRLYVLAVPPEANVGSTGLSPEEAKERERKAKMARVKKAEQAFIKDLEERAKVKLKAAAKEGMGGRFGPLINTVLGNLQVRITRVHVRYEDATTCPGVRMAAGLTLQRLSAQTVDEQGRETFVATDVFSKLRKSAVLERFAFYCDVENPTLYSDPDRLPVWLQGGVEGWDSVFLPGIHEESGEGAAAASPPAQRFYLLRPLNGRLVYTRKGKTAAITDGKGGSQRSVSPTPEQRELRGAADHGRDPSAGDEPAQGASLQLDALALRLSDTHYRALGALSEEIGMYRRRRPHAKLRPVLRPLPLPGTGTVGPSGERVSNKAALQWWRYAIEAVTRGVRKSHRIDWGDIRRFALIRKQYVPYYSDRLLLLGVGGGLGKAKEKEKEPVEDATITAWDDQLDERQIVIFRKMAHARAFKLRQDKDKPSRFGRREPSTAPSRATSLAAAEQAQSTPPPKTSLVSRLFGWGGGAKPAPTEGLSPFDKGLKVPPEVTPESIPNPDEPAPSLSSEDMDQLETFIQENGDWRDAADEGEGEDAADLGEDDLKSQLQQGRRGTAAHPWFLRLRLTVKTQEMSIGLVQNGTDLCHVAVHGFCARVLQYPKTVAGTASIQRLEAITAVGPLLTSSLDTAAGDASPNVLSVNFVSNPQDGSADQIVEASLAPLYITFDRAALQRIQAFFKLSSSSPSSDTATAEAATRDVLQTLGNQAAAQADQIRRRAEQQLQYALLSKKRVLISLDLAAPKVAVPLHSLAPERSHDPSSVYSVAVIDMGQVTVSTNEEALEELPISPECKALYHCYSVSVSQIALYFADSPPKPAPFGWTLHSQMLQLLSQSTLEQCSAPRDEQSGWVALPFVQRVRAEATALVARAQHPKYAKMFLDLRIPSVDLQISPQRTNRLLRLLRAVTTPMIPPDATPKPALQTWLKSASRVGDVQVLKVGLLRAGASWQPHCAALWETSLYLLESQTALRATEQISVAEGYEVRRVHLSLLRSLGIKPPSEDFSEHAFGIVVVPVGAKEPHQMVLSREATLFVGQTEEETREWLSSLTAANVADRSDSVSAAGLFESASSEVSADVRREDSASTVSATGGPTALSPGMVVRGELSRLRVGLSGVGPKAGWERDVLGGGLSTAVPAPAPLGSVLDVDQERPLMLMTASEAGLMFHSSALPGSITIEVGLGSLHVQDLLMDRPFLSQGKAPDGAQPLEPTTALGAPDIALVPKTRTELREEGASPREAGAEEEEEEEDAFFEPTAVVDQGQVLPLLLGQSVPLSSSLSSAQFARIKVAMCQPFHPSYQGINTDLEIRFAAITLHVSRPTGAAFTSTGLAFARALPPPIPGTAPPPPPPAATSGAPTDLIGSRVNLRFDGVRIVLAYESKGTRPFAIAEMASWHLQVATGPRGVDLLTSVGNIHMSDGSVPISHPYRRILATKGDGSDSLIRLHLLYTTRTPDHLLDRCPEGLPTVHVDLRMTEMRALYLNRFVSEMLSYIRGYLDMRAVLPPPDPSPSPVAPAVLSTASAPSPTISVPEARSEAHHGAQSSPDVRASSAGASSSAPAEPAPMAILLDIDMDAPVVVMPRGTDAPDHLEMDLGRLQLTNRVGWLRQHADAPAAVLVDDMTIELTQLRAKTSAEKGSPATDLLIEEGAVFSLDLRRPLRDPFKLLPGTDIRIDMPSFRGRMSDQQYLFITAVAQANLNEDMRIPKGAFFRHVGPVPLPPHVQPHAEPSKATEVAMVPLAALDRTPPLSMQLRVSIGEVQLSLEKAIQLPGVTGAGSWRREALASAVLKGLSLNMRQKPNGGGMALDLSVPVLELRDKRASRNHGGDDASFEGIPVLSSSGVGSILGGDGQLDAAAALASGPPAPSTLLVLHFDQSPTNRAVKLLLQQPTMAVETAFLLTMMQFFVPGQGDKNGGNSKKDGSGASRVQPFISLDIRLPPPAVDRDPSASPTVIKLQRDLYLSPASRLLWDQGPSSAGELTLDLDGHSIWLPDVSPANEAPVPLILIGSGRRLRLCNGTVVNAAGLGGAVLLGVGSALLMDQETDRIKLQLQASPGSSEVSLATSGGARSAQEEAGDAIVHVSEYRGLILQGDEFLVPVRAHPQTQPAAATPPATGDGNIPEAQAPPAPQGFKTEVQIEAVGCCFAVSGSPRASEASVQIAVSSSSLSPTPSQPQNLLRHSLVALLDLTCELSMGGGAQQQQAPQQRGLPAASGPASMLLTAKAQGLTLESLQHVVTSGTGHLASNANLLSRGRVLDPCDIAVQLRQGVRGKDVHMQATDLRVKVSPYLADLLTVLQSELVAPVLRASPDRPLATSRGYDLVARLPLTLGGKPGALRVTDGWGETVSVWKPRAPAGYASLGHALTVGSEHPPHSASVCVGLNSGLAAHPTGFTRIWPPRDDTAFASSLYSKDSGELGMSSGEGLHIWFPIAPEGFRALGCLVTDGPVAPEVIAVACLRDEACVPSDLTATLRACPDAVESDFVDLIMAGGPGGTFFALPRAVSQQGAWRLSDVARKLALRPRTPLGLSPLQVCQTVPWLLRDRERARLTAKGVNDVDGILETPGVRMGTQSGSLELDLPEWMLAAAGEALEAYRQSVINVGKVLASSATKGSGKAALSPSSSGLLRTTAEFKKIWWTREAPMDSKDGVGAEGLSLWRPIAPPGYKPLGHSLVHGFLGPLEGWVVADDSDYVRPPTAFELVWRLPGRERVRPLHIWKPVPPEGYVALGYVATSEPERPSVDSIRVLRADAAKAFELPKPTWTVRTRVHGDQQVDLGAYIIDELSGLFVCDGPNGRARAFAVQMPSSGQAAVSAEEERQIQQAAESQASNVVVEVGRTSVLLCDMHGRPLVDFGLGEIRAGLHSPEPGVLSTVATLNMEAWSYHRRRRAWEPILEPWEAHVAVEMNKSGRGVADAGIGASPPGISVKVSGMSEVLSLSLAHAALDSIIDATAEWRSYQLRKGRANHADDKAAVLATQGAQARRTVRNLLNTDVHLRTDYGRSFGQLHLPPGTASALALPQQEIPTRGSLRHSPPRLALAVTVGSLTLERRPSTAGATERKAEKKGEAAVHPGDLLCLVSLNQDQVAAALATGADREERMHILPLSRTGYRESSLPDEDARSVDLADFSETLMLPLDPQEIAAKETHDETVTIFVSVLRDKSEGLNVAAKGTLELNKSTLRNLVKRAIDGDLALEGKTPILCALGSTPVALDCPPGGPEYAGASLSLQCTVSLVVHQTAEPGQGRGARTLKGHTRGQRAVAIYSDGPWVLLPPPATLRTYPSHWNLTSALQSNAKTAPLLAMTERSQRVGPGGAGQALTSSLTALAIGENSQTVVLEEVALPGEGAARVEIVRSLCQLMNATLVPQEVCLVMRDLAWVEDLKTAQQASAQVRPDEDFTLLAEEEVFENHRFMPLRGFSPNFLSRLERQRYSDLLGTKSSSTFPEVALPPGWVWDGDWEIDREGKNVDAEGWQYGLDFSKLQWPPRMGDEKQQVMYCVRRRRFRRRRRRDHRGAAPPPSAPKNLVEGAQDAEEVGARVVELGMLQPGERLSLPLEAFNRDVDVTVRFRPVDPDAKFTWSVVEPSGSGGTTNSRGLNLGELRDNLSVLLKSTPLEAGASSDEGAGFWSAALVEGKTVDVHTRYGLDRAYDWLITLAPPLLLDNSLPLPAQAILASEQGSGVFEGQILAGETVPVHHVNPLLPLVLRYEPQGMQYDDRGPLRLNPQLVIQSANQGPVMLSCTFKTPESSSTGSLRGPQLVTGFVSARPLVSEGFDVNEWETVSGPGGPLSPPRGKKKASTVFAPLQLRMFSPVSVENRSDLTVQLAVVDLGPVQRSESSSEGLGLFSALEQVQQAASAGSSAPSAPADGPTVIDVTDPRKTLRSSPVCASLVGSSSLGLASYPIQQVNEMFGLQIRVEGSGWSDSLPLANHGGASTVGGNGNGGGSNGGAAAAAGASSSYLLRFLDHNSGLVKDVIVSIDLSQDRESSLLIRIDPVYLISNRTPFPLFLRDPGGLAVTVKPGEALRPLHFSAKNARQPKVLFGLEPTDSVLSTALKLQEATVATEDIVMTLRCRASLASAAGVVLPPSLGLLSLTESSVVQLPLKAKVECLSGGAIHLAVTGVGGSGPYVLSNLSLGPVSFKTPGTAWQTVAAFASRDLSSAWSEIEQPSPRHVELLAGSPSDQATARARVLTLEHPTASESGRKDRTIAVLPGGAVSAGGAPGKRMGKLQVAPTPEAPKPPPLLTEVGFEEGLLCSDPSAPLVLRVRMIGGRGNRVQTGAVAAARASSAAAQSSSNAATSAVDAEESEPSKSRFCLTLTIPSVEVSVIDHLPREILLICLKSVNVEFAAGLGVQGSTATRLQIGDLIVNDMRAFSAYPVVLYKDPKKGFVKGQPLLTVALTRTPSRPPFSTMPLIYLHVNGRLIASVDESLIWRLQEAVQQINLARLNPKAPPAVPVRGKGTGSKSSVNLAAAQSAAAAARQQQSGNGSSGGRVAAPETVLDLGVLHLAIPSIRFFFAANELHRPRSLKNNNLISLGLALGSVEGLKLPGAILGRENEVVRSSALRRAVIDLVVTNVLRSLPSIIWNASWGRGIGKAIGSVQQGVDSVLSVISGEEPVTAQPDQQQASNLMEGMLGGAQSVGQGLFKGFTGLITKPMEGAKKDGVVGAAKGIFHGIAGVVVNPVSGVVQGMARAAEGAVSEVQTRSKQIGTGGAELGRVLLGTVKQSEEEGSGTVERLRLPRHFASDQVLVPYDEGEAKGQELCWSALKARQASSDIMSLTEKVLSAERLCESERFEWARTLDDQSKILMATSGRLLLLELNSRPGEVRVVWDVLFTEILGFELEMTRPAFDRKLPPDVLVIHLKGTPPVNPATSRSTAFQPIEALTSLLGSPDSGDLLGPAPVFRRDIYCKTGGDLAVQLRAVLRATYRARLPPEAIAVPKILSPDVPAVHQSAFGSLAQASSSIAGSMAGSVTPLSLQSQLSMQPSGTPEHHRSVSRVAEMGGALSSVDSANLVALATHMPCVRYECVWRGRRDMGPKSLTIWRPIGPPGYHAVGDVLRIGLDPPETPALVFRENDPAAPQCTLEDAGEVSLRRTGASGPPLMPPVGYTLVWRDAGSKGAKVAPVSVWVPDAPLGYTAIGCVARSDLLEPPLDAVRCVRKDLCRVSTYRNHPLMELKAKDALGWGLVLWEVENTATTFHAVRNGRMNQLPGREPLEVLIQSAGGL